MKPSRRILLPVVAVVLVGAMALPALAASVSILNLISGWQAGHAACSSVEDNLRTGASAYGLENICSIMPDSVSDTPEFTIADWLSDAKYASEDATVYLRTHGNTGAIAIEYYSTKDARDDAYTAYISAGSYTAAEVLKGKTEGTPGIGITSAFITNHVPGAGSSIAIQHFCYGVGTSSSFTGAGLGSVFAIADTTSSADCPDYNTVTARLGCVPDASNVLPVGTTGTAAAGLIRLGLSGSTTNTMLNGKSCINSAVSFSSVGMEGHLVRFSTETERDEKEFLVLGGYDDEQDGNGRPRRYELTRLAAEGGPGIHQPYEISVRLSYPGKRPYDYFQIVAIGTSGRVDRISEPFSAGSPSYPWVPQRIAWASREDRPSVGTAPKQESLKTVRVYVGHAPDEDRWELVSEYQGTPPAVYSTASQAELHPGDIVLISSHEDLLVNAYWYIKNSMLPPGQEIAAWLVGGTDWLDARFGVQIAIDQNEGYNLQNGVSRFRTYVPGPYVLIVGDAGPQDYGGEDQIISHAKWTDPDPDRCVYTYCKGDWQITDVRETGLPNGPISRLVGDNWTDEILPQLEASHAWTQLASIQSTFPKGLWLLGDGLIRDSNPPLPANPDLGPVIEEWMQSASWITTELIKQSQFPTVDEKRAFFLDRLNDLDPMVIVATGIASREDSSPGGFLGAREPDQTKILPGKPFVYFGICCETACSDCDAVFTTTSFEPFIGSDKPFAGWFGTASNDYLVNHLQIWPYIEQELAQADGSETMQYSIWKGLYQAAQDPALLPTVRGYLMFGGPLFNFNAQLIATDVQPEGVSPAYMFTKVYPNPGSGAQGQTLSFRIPRPGRVELRIYDVRGRLIRTLQARNLDAGAHTMVWDAQDRDGRPVSTGTYFARMVFDDTGNTVTRKLSIVK